MQAAGHQVTPVIGDPVNLKITWPKDIRWAEIYLNELIKWRVRCELAKVSTYTD